MYLTKHYNIVFLRKPLLQLVTNVLVHISFVLSFSVQDNHVQVPDEFHISVQSLIQKIEYRDYRKVLLELQ